ncbi:MAG TPA: hypothetical protein VI409_07445 [Gaiellaceae bacterium]|nr:hypothetical protein [Gaiellaceae bacterium]
MIERARRLAPALWLGVLVLGVAGCGGAQSSASEAAGDAPLATQLALLPDQPELRRHVLVADLERLRLAYPEEADLRVALAGVWLPDALVGADRALWRRAYGLGLEDISAFASAGYHPAELTVADGELTPSAMRTAFVRSGYRASPGGFARGEDGSIDVTSEAGRLALSSLNRVVVSARRVIAASTTLLSQAARSPTNTLAARGDFSAAATALDPITSAVVLDAQLVRPPFGVPFETLPQHSADLIAVGIDDAGSEGRMLKIALVYSDPEQARSDAELIERDLESTELPGAPGSRFADVASEWNVTADDRVVLITASLSPEQQSGIWRLLVERGDLAPFVRPRR